MGVPLGDVLPRKKISLEELRAKKIAIDAYNALYQFLASIRQPDGTPLMNSRGETTSHLSGLFYRTIKLMEEGVKPIYVFDGTPPQQKIRTLEKRKERKEEALEKWEEALREGKIDEAKKYAQAALFLKDEMVEESKALLEAMGVPFVQAPSEGEAQAAHMAKKGDVWAAGSQDYDSILFGAPRLVRNLAITGKRKLPGKDIYVDTAPELVEWEEVERSLGINRRRLIWVGMLLGTDYNEKIPGIGPKKALELVRQHDSFEEILRATGYRPLWDWRAVEEFFMNPPVTDDYEVKYREPDEEKILEILVEKNDFSRERVERAIERLAEVSPAEGEQTSLDAWFS